jgi:hypothetical protein
LPGIVLGHEPDERRLKVTGRPYTSREAYIALEPRQGSPDLIGQRIWKMQVPNKVKIFAWLYFKDRMSTRGNLFAKHVLDDDICRRCSNDVENKGRVFLRCSSSMKLWGRLRLRDVGIISDTDV